MKVYSFSGAKEYQNKSVFNVLAPERSYRPWDFVVAFVFAVQFLSHIWLFVTPWTAACQVPLSSSISWSLLRFMSIESVVLSNHLILCHPLLLPSIFPSIRVFSNELSLYLVANYWSFSIIASNEYSGLISFRIHWFDLAVRGTFKNLLHHN